MSTSSFGEYATTITALARHHVDFVICGGVACLMYGSPRSTADLDLLVNLTDENLKRFVAAMRELGLQPRIPEPMEALLDPAKRANWIEQKNAMAYTLVSPLSPLQVDVFLTYPLTYAEVSSAARVAVVGDVRFRISSVEHLIHAKKLIQPPRDGDLIDLRHLQRLSDRNEES